MQVKKQQLKLDMEKETSSKLGEEYGKVVEFQKNIYFCFIDYAKAFDCVDHNKLWKILKELGILDHLTCLLRNLYAGQEATVRTRHGTTDWFQIGKGVHPGYILSPCLFNLYAEWKVKVKVVQSCLTLCDPMDCPWNSLGQNTGVGSLSLLQGIFLTQESNPGLLPCRQIFYQLSWRLALFVMAKTWKQPKCSLIDECIKKMWYMYTMEYYSALNRGISCYLWQHR